MQAAQRYHPAEAETLAFFELKLHTVMEQHFRALRERVTALAQRDGTLPVTFWMCERDAMVKLLSPVYEAGLRLGIELERPPRTALNTVVNLNVGLYSTLQRLATEMAQEITVSTARYVSDLLNMGLNPQGLPDRLRQELRESILSDSRAEQVATQQAGRVIAAGKLLAHPRRPVEWVEARELEVNRLCI